MTAIRVVTDHQELDNSGQVPHSDIDTYVTGSAFLVVSGSGPLPPSGRRLAVGPGIMISDAGPGGDLTLSSSGSLPLPTQPGQLLFCVVAGKFSISLPITSMNSGWLVNNSGLLLVSSSI